MEIRTSKKLKLIKGLTMSLKFGLYLVEQGIITCDQFCGLVKIQQESKSAVGTIAIQKNLMTIRQVAKVLEHLETIGTKTFVEVAIEMDFLDQADGIKLQQLDQLSRPTIRQIIVNVGLMNQRQIGMLFEHHERVQNRLRDQYRKSRSENTKPTKPVPAPATPRRPKFQQRPVEVSQHHTSNI